MATAGARPRISWTALVLDCADAHALADFYSALLGWADVQPREAGWAQVGGGGTRLSLQAEPGFVRPVWPSVAGHQQMQMHLDCLVDDLDAASAWAWAVSLGATVATTQPSEGVRVHLDPAGHPFCLFLAGW